MGTLPPSLACVVPIVELAVTVVVIHVGAFTTSIVQAPSTESTVLEAKQDWIVTADSRTVKMEHTSSRSGRVASALLLAKSANTEATVQLERYILKAWFWKVNTEEKDKSI